MSRVQVHALPHDDLTTHDITALRALFDPEYYDEYGEWNHQAPYGYAPADTHVVAIEADVVIGHASFGRRLISVGHREVAIAGTGGVLVAGSHRGSGVGRTLMHHVRMEMRASIDIEFGYLGCRPAVVPFYQSCGWQRINVREQRASRADPAVTVDSLDSPILICAAARRVCDWPTGDVDLRGLPW